MEGFLVFLIAVCIIVRSYYLKAERHKQMESRMEGHYRKEREKRKHKRLERWNLQIIRAGFPIPRPFIPYVVMVFAVLVGYLCSLKMGQAGFLLGLLLGPFLFDRLIAFLVKQNEKRFIQDFDLSLDVGASIFRAHGTIDDYVAESQKIVNYGWFSREMKIVENRLKEGISVPQAFEELADRVDIEAVHYAAQALRSTTEEGGNLAAVFDDIKMMISRSVGAQRKAMAKTVELRRMGYLLIGISFVVPLGFRHQLAELISTRPIILFIIIGALLLNSVGAVIVFRAVKIRV
ncbi:type II secretion system F family protein [Aneurinibacillus terranovensis]|uniref:type II secretion system F family protein n=1 Tax=Aneurinibacillus terranovensis TaxID=278991 RepID=UPI0004291507|nr:type II secretion system F family protein [Aneurinibacillus terranovensis]